MSFFFLSRDIMNNKVFYQHPNLMRILGMHETVMEVMVNVLGGDKSQVHQLLPLYLFLLTQTVKDAPTGFTAPPCQKSCCSLRKFVFGSSFVCYC